MISLHQLEIHQGDFSLAGIDLQIEKGQYAILMGQTGCGKTTLLEAICGLRNVESGRILLEGRDVTRLAPSARAVGYVPQDSALFPTMRVEDQIEFGLAVRSASKAERRKRVERLSELLDISSILKRFPAGLSGGEKQRVALARALSFRPKLLCLDEPLSALDDATRSKLTGLLRDVHAEEKVTVLHITHNASEARQLGTVQFRLVAGKVVAAENV
ncbi:MAG: ATP-binding cassette domain-containing protein [Planctomycetota bacterium]